MAKSLNFAVNSSKRGITMNLFAYISLGELGKILQRKVGEIGSSLDADKDKVSSQQFEEGERYLELFEDLETVKVMQRFYGSKPQFEEGGVVVKVNVPSRVALPRTGTSIFRFDDGNGENYIEVRTFPVKSDKLRIDNFEDVVFDPKCESYIEDIRCDFDFKSRENA